MLTSHLNSLRVLNQWTSKITSYPLSGNTHIFAMKSLPYIAHLKSMHTNLHSNTQPFTTMTRKGLMVTMLHPPTWATYLSTKLRVLPESIMICSLLFPTKPCTCMVCRLEDLLKACMEILIIAPSNSASTPPFASSAGSSSPSMR